MSNALIWDQLDKIQSLGLSTKKAKCLGELHETREKTLSQFFTPAFVVKYAWDSIAPAFKDKSFYSLLDNSLGSASQFRYANPDQFSLSGFDIDQALVNEVSSLFADSDYSTDFVYASMEDVKLSEYSAALINPPFSIPLSSPFLSAYEGITHYGRHGKDTSANSTEYAVAQALEHADIVCAVVPHSATQTFKSISWIESRLVAIYQLPTNTFTAEGVKQVNTDLLIFQAFDREEGQTVIAHKIDQSSIASPLNFLHCRSIRQLSNRDIRTHQLDPSSPVITLPASDDKRVLLKKAGQWIKLYFFDGATKGRVLNAIYREKLTHGRLNRIGKDAKYRGQFMLNIDTLVLQPDPFKALHHVCDIIRTAGGEPHLTEQLIKGLKRAITHHQKMTVPYGRWVYRKGAPDIKGTARYTKLLNSHQKGAIVKQGEEITGVRTDAGFLVHTERGLFECSHDVFFDSFDLPESVSTTGYWEETHPPIENLYPKEIEELRTKAIALGLDKWLSWNYQFTDLLELAFRPAGAIIGWQMALGKSRLNLALAKLLTGKSLIVVKSRLVDEMENELRKLNVSSDEYQIIRTIKDTRNTKKINIISYNLLRAPIAAGQRKLIAHLLKGQIKNMICDEGGLLANDKTAQSRACKVVGANKRFCSDGTPMPNYPVEMLALAKWVYGEARSFQPYSEKFTMRIPGLFSGAKNVPTGRDAFLDDYVCFGWSTNEYRENGTGAKRMLPRVNNVVKFREWINPMVCRRVQQEPDVAKEVTFPVPVFQTPIEVRWDLKHLALYVDVSERFASWYKQYKANAIENNKGLNLALILLRMEACFKAANAPSMLEEFGEPYNSTTSKEEATIDLIIEEVKKGRRPIVFAKNPVVLERLSEMLDAHNITSLVFTGKKTIDKRTKELNEQIRNGDTQVMLGSYGVSQDGLNLPQLTSVILYNRSYKAREELQAIYRLLRADQPLDSVCVHYLHLEGSIDAYMSQIIEWKLFANEAGLDYGEQPDDEDFDHFDTFIQRYLESIPLLKEQVKRLNRQAA